ncbi:MAG: 16S rRNA (cytosine(1402)-N(4))-methyltransferase RsmH [Patescibacteria group bacterium]|nr:16S rRNA (cytosine(1402)-N(4))-methyltransferase RsmH [Patescibacteria group bacterium]MDD5554950.1 16S rRNA (cytosine(1402)-N(4))-methyltransferase RsmH [Patescibacteria group bacterium]
MEYKHEPVMIKEVLEYLRPGKGQFFIDCTLGGAGYTIAIAERVGETGRVLSIDLDEMAVANARGLISDKKLTNIILVNENFKNLSKIIKKYFPEENQTGRFSGIVFDLGLSSAQLEDKSRGFSFQLAAPLDMAFGPLAGRRTEEIINNWPEADLKKIISEYGEEKFAGNIARSIIKRRKEGKIKTTGELTEIIAGAVPKKYQNARIHPATRTFQALRIATNDELENLRQVLPTAVSLLKSGGRIAVVSFHSLEDRIIKNFFRQEARGCLCPPNFPICQCGHKASLKILTKKVIKPGGEEVAKNPRARSACLRVAEKIKNL